MISIQLGTELFEMITGWQSTKIDEARSVDIV